MNNKKMSEIARKKAELYAAEKICGMFPEGDIHVKFLKELYDGIEQEMREAYIIGYSEALEDVLLKLG